MSVKHRRFLKKVLYKYKIISIKVCSFVGKKQKRPTSSLSGVIHLPLSSLIEICRHCLHLFHGAKGEENGNPFQYSFFFSHSSILVRRILWTEERGGLLSIELHRVRHNWSDLACIALEKKMATHSSILSWRIPGTEEPGGLPSVGSHRVGHNWSDAAAAAAWSKVARPSEGWIVSFYFLFIYFLNCLFLNSNLLLTCLFLLLLLFFLAKSHGTWDLSLLTRDWTHVPSIGSTREIWLNFSWD